MTGVVWVAWQGSTVSHAAPGVDTRDVRKGSFPLACGRWAPDAWNVDGDGVYCGPAASVKPRCRRCDKYLTAAAGSVMVSS